MPDSSPQAAIRESPVLFVRRRLPAARRWLTRQPANGPLGDSAKPALALAHGEYVASRDGKLPASAHGPCSGDQLVAGRGPKEIYLHFGADDDTAKPRAAGKGKSIVGEEGNGAPVHEAVLLAKRFLDRKNELDAAVIGAVAKLDPKQPAEGLRGQRNLRYPHEAF